jgi:SNF2 family DNA or RNA helicase
MRLMTDVSEECSRHAACAFAILVRVAPLSASCIDNNNDAAQTNAEPTGKVSDDVIKHLILGKPLPPCEIPSSITLALQQSGTVLRPYQVEGISWIKFLSDVNLNGALCDDMG